MSTTSAIVIGGSLAGMCAARVLSDFVDRVTIVERDAYPSSHDFRSGVPQARHVHNLLARGLREFEGFFPGFEHRRRETGRRWWGAYVKSGFIFPVLQIYQRGR